MSPEQKTRIVDQLLDSLRDSFTSEDMPVLVGTLLTTVGIKGFTPASPGHPVFEYKDRYIIYLESEKELTEKVYDQNKQQYNTKVGIFNVAIPYYKASLKPHIKFSELEK